MRKYKIKPNVIADAIIIAGLIAGSIYLAHAKKAENNTPENNEQVAVVNLATTTRKEPAGFAVPGGNTAFKTYMDYRAITNTQSPQYKLQDSCWTDENGLRRYGDDYVIAVGSYFADHVGERLEITLDSGEEFTAIVGDFKADSHTDNTHRYTAMSNGGKNVIEFVVDTKQLPRKARQMGDISYIEGFAGDVSEIAICEEKGI